MPPAPDIKQFAHKTLRRTKEVLRLKAQLAYASVAIWSKPARPDFFVIGAPRAATTWMHARLKHHPSIYLPKVKELHFFDEPPLSDKAVMGFNLSRRFYFDISKPSRLRWYARQFVDAQGLISGDITPDYSALSERRVGEIAELMPTLKVIYTFRDPVDRTWSGLRRTLWWRKALRPEDVENSDDLMELAMLPDMLKFGDYKTNIARWEKYFPADQILYLFYEDICDNPTREIARVCNFLNVDPSLMPVREETNERVNAAPAGDMPDAIYQALTSYYDGQADFIQRKFGRDLSHWLR